MSGKGPNTVRIPKPRACRGRINSRPARSTESDANGATTWPQMCFVQQELTSDEGQSSHAPHHERSAG